MKNHLAIILILIASLNCGDNTLGGTEAGNPATIREVIGTVANNTSTSANFALASESCPADQIIATDSTAQTTTATINSNCSFSLNLTPQKAYVLSLLLNDSFMATVIFNNNSNTLSSTVIIVSSGTTAIDLGVVTINGSTATPENQPASQSDLDDDDIFDFDDDDDDNNGVSDDAETDCDLDGYQDSYDDDDDSCDDDSEDIETEDTEQAIVFEVNPKNGASNIQTNEDIEARFGCEIDLTTVNNTNFQVTSETETITCDFESSSSDTRIDCEPESDFEINTTVTVTLNGIQCASGDTVSTITWSFATGED